MATTVKPFGTWDTVYKNFHIVPSSWTGFDFYHDNYDGAPDAGGGFYNTGGNESTVAKCKEAIDELYLDNPEYICG